VAAVGYLLLLYGIDCDLLLLVGIVSHDILLLIAIAANWYYCYFRVDACVSLY